MRYFEYDRSDAKAEYYETLMNLMERWEHEIVEFKEAKGGYNEDKIGQYFSAISNEANLLGCQYGWFVLGVSESGARKPVGTAFKSGDSTLLEKFKYEIARNTTDGITFLEIIELYPICDGKPCRVLMFKIPAAVVGMPTNLYLSAEVAQSIDAEAQYIRNRAFDNQYYRDMIVNYLQSYGKASRQDIRNLLWDKLPDVLDDKQKEGRISTLLTSMRRKGIVTRDSESQQNSCWILVEGSTATHRKK